MQMLRSKLMQGQITPQEAELARIRIERLKKEQAPQAPNQTVVQQGIQKLTQNAEPGVAGLDTGNAIPQEYAQGGIIAFEEGGGVKGYSGEDDESLVQLDKAIAAYSGMYNPLEITPKSAGIQQALETLKAKKKAILADQLRQKNTEAFLKKDATKQLKDPLYIANANKSRIENEMALGMYDNAIKDFANKGATNDPNANPGATPGYVMGKAPQFKDYTPTKIDENIYNADIARAQEKMAPGYAQAEGKRLRGEYGISDDLYQTQLGDIAKERENIKGDKEKAIWESLLMGGLKAAAGRSQYGITNIAEGLGLGAENYVKSMKDLKAEEKALRREDMEVRRLDNAAKQAMLDGDTARADKYEAKRDALVDKKQARTDKNIDALNEAEKFNKQLKWNGELKIWEVNTEADAGIRKAEIAAAPYNKLFQQQATETRLDQATVNNRLKYVKDALEAAPAYKAMLSMDPSGMSGPRLEKYNQALAFKQQLEAKAAQLFPGMGGSGNMASPSANTLQGIKTFNYIPGRGLVQE